MTSNKVSEDELITDCRRGDDSMQRLFFEQFSGRMMSVCRRYSKDKMEAEDMLQIGFMKAFTHLDQHNGGSLEGWLKRIFINTCLSQLKKNRQSLLVSDLTEMEGIDLEEDGLERLQAGELMKLIDGLPPGAKVIFNLFAIEGYPHTEIATLLEISESTSRAQLTRARKILQQQLRNHF